MPTWGRGGAWLAALGCLVAATGLARAADPEPALRLYVSQQGRDTWSGRLPAPAADGRDGPFATLERARDTIRRLRNTSPLPAGGVTVEVRGGRYPLAATWLLQNKDSGTPQAPIVYQAYPGERPTLLGGRVVSGFVTHQGRVLKADLGAQGIGRADLRQLICNGRRQPLARYPNFEPDNPIAGGWAAVDGDPVPMYTDRPDDTRSQLRCRPADARLWAHPADGEVFIFARYNWFNNLVRIKAYNPATRTITLAGNASYAIRPTDRYFVQGLFEELDAPGEWCYDPRTSTLYFWPPDGVDPATMTVVVPTLPTVVQLDPGSRHLTLRGLTIEASEGHAVLLRDCEDCRVVGCTIRNVGYYNGSGVVVEGGFRNQVVGNDLDHVGRDAISLTGGDRITLTAGEHVADNNYVHHPGVYYRWGRGIYLVGCGLRATHNLVHDCPRAGISFLGNNLLMEYNHLHHLCLDSEDASGLGTSGRDWISSRGSVVRYNLIHDVLGFGRSGGRWVTPFFAWGIYLDDNTGGVDVVGNVVTRCGRAALHLHNARDIVVENNVFTGNGRYELELSGWTAQSATWQRHLPTMVAGYESVAGQPAWQALRGMATHPRQAPLPNGLIMAGNRFERNIVANANPAVQLYHLRNVDLEHNRWDRNLLWQFGQPPVLEGVGDVALADRWAAWRAQGEDPGSAVADPGFVDAARDDYRLRPDSPARALGFTDLPLDQIGLYASAWRASWPVVE